MKFIIDKEKYIDSGLINEQSHPTLPLLIYNYSQQCQFSKAWDDVTKMCRGLIVHKDTREIVARPFPKFFNYEEHILTQKIPDEKPYVLEKMDGSLGILYWYEGQPYIATRGSFASDQAVWATQWLRENVPLGDFDMDKTYLFEIIYPQNRIVVNYDFSGLVLLDIIDTETGKRTYPSIVYPQVQKIQVYEFSSYEVLKALNTPNSEGFVLVYPETELRLKIKFADYVRLHKIMTGLSEIGIWEMLRDGKNPITPEIPDEMFNWINGIVNTLGKRFEEIRFEVNDFASKVVAPMGLKGASRREIAEEIKKAKYPGLQFSDLDGKDFTPAIWKMIRPRGSVTFKNDIDA